MKIVNVKNFIRTTVKTFGWKRLWREQNKKLFLEAVVRRNSVKKVFLEISQNFENTCAGVSFLIKLQA